MKRIDMPRDAWIGVVFFVLAVVFWIAADGIRISPLDGPVTAAGLPKTLAYALGILAVLLILRSLALKRTTTVKRTAAVKPAPAPGEGPADDAERPALYRHLRAIGMLAFGVGYLLLVPYLGYLLSIIGLMLGVAIYMGARLGAKTGAVAGLGGLFFYLLFVQLLDVPLPDGFWPTLLGTLQG